MILTWIASACLFLKNRNIKREYYDKRFFVRNMAELMFYYASNFKEVDGAYWFGCVYPSVRLSVTLAYLRSRTVIDLVKFYI